MTIHSFKPTCRRRRSASVRSAGCGPISSSSWINTLLTLVGLYLLWLIVPPVLEWAIFKADWTGDTRADCSREGACCFVQVRFGQFMYGFYPTELRWRVDAAAWLAIIGAALFCAADAAQAALRHRLPAGLSAAGLLAAAWRIPRVADGADQSVGGLMLTVVIAAVGIAGALPLGICWRSGDARTCRPSACSA